MQTPKEVDTMHTAIIRGRATGLLVALLASVALATTFAPIIDGDGSRPEPSIMPGASCPPLC